MTKLCLVCGRLEVDHHEYSPAPAGCKCHPGDWEGCNDVPLVCLAFRPQSNDKDRCLLCEHDRACHPAALPGAEPTKGYWSDEAVAADAEAAISDALAEPTKEGPR